jgi:hypothetical protein
MKRFQSMLAVLLLLAYASSATSIMPAVFAVLAALDGSHRVMICRTEHGTEVRLHHRENDYTPEVCDHTGVLARLVVSLSRPAAEGDHSLSTSQVTGNFGGRDDESERDCKEKQNGSVPLAGPEFHVVWRAVPRTLFRLADWNIRERGGTALQEMATIRLMI